MFHPEAANEHTSLQAQRRCIQSSRDHAGGKTDGSRHPSDRHGQVDDSLQARGAVEQYPHKHFLWLSPGEYIYKTQLENIDTQFSNIEYNAMI